MSACSLPSDHHHYKNYIVACVRYLYHKLDSDILDDENTDLKYNKYDIVTPGNDKRCDFFNYDKNINPGNNFWWNNWQQQYFHKKNILKRRSEYNLYYIIDRIELQIVYITNTYQKYTRNTDFRIVNVNDNILVHSSNLDCIYTIKVDIEPNDKKFKIEILQEFDNEHIAHLNDKRCYDQMIDINMSFLSFDNYTFTWLNWFREKYKEDENGKEQIISYYLETFNTKMKEIKGAFDEDVLSLKCIGKNKFIENIKFGGINEDFPNFSFSTPCIKVGDIHIGVGHLKIDTKHFDNYLEKSYPENSNVNLFQNITYELFSDLFDNKYMFCRSTENCKRGFNYLSYFYIIKNGKMFISNGFIPINTSMEYKFSLIFSMGLYLSNDEKKITITSGEGDFYNSFLTFDLDNVISECIYDIQTMDKNEYGYQIIFHNNNENYTNLLIKNNKIFLNGNDIDVTNYLNEIKKRDMQIKSIVDKIQVEKNETNKKLIYEESSQYIKASRNDLKNISKNIFKILYDLQIENNTPLSGGLINLQSKRKYILIK